MRGRHLIHSSNPPYMHTCKGRHVSHVGTTPVAVRCSALQFVAACSSMMIWLTHIEPALCRHKKQQRIMVILLCPTTVVRWISHASIIRIWMSHDTDMNESCHRHEWVMSQTWMSHTSDKNESCHRHEWVTSQKWTSHVPHVNEKCPTRDMRESYSPDAWVTLHVRKHYWHIHKSCLTLHTWMSHVPHMKGSCSIDASVTPH